MTISKTRPDRDIMVNRSDMISEDYNQEKLLKPNCRIWIKPVLLDLPLIVSMNIAVIIKICFQMLELLRYLSIYI